jgi:hypothetical protein
VVNHHSITYAGLAEALDVATDYLLGRGAGISATVVADRLHHDIQKLKATDYSQRI